MHWIVLSETDTDNAARIPSGPAQATAVAASVFLLNTGINIGIDAICEGCAEGRSGAEQTPRGIGRT